MKRHFLWIVLLLIGFTANAQKIKVKKNNLTVDGTAIAQIEKIGCGTFNYNCTYYVYDLEGELMMNVKVMIPAIPIESVRNFYMRFAFVGIEGFAEIPTNSTKPKRIAETIVKSRLIKDNALNEAAVEQFIIMNGTPISDIQNKVNAQYIYIENLNE